MTILYEVKTKHTKEVLKAFVKFDGANRNDKAKIMLRYGVLAALFFALPKAFEMPPVCDVISWGVGFAVVAMALAKDYLNYVNLLQKDRLYLSGTEIRMSFGLSAFEVQDDEKNTYKYHLIKKMYEDKQMFYLHMEEGDLFIIPREDFVQGDPDEFREFLERTTEKKFEAAKPADRKEKGFQKKDK